MAHLTDLSLSTVGRLSPKSAICKNTYGHRVNKNREILVRSLSISTVSKQFKSFIWLLYNKMEKITREHFLFINL
ncbi:hypothetical protein T01_14386 [Trichinella spiralis]|uniref:Uncharacterized protein n=1 Tax=Trichinella spiralis TaxID=6334 RepID=A0A0V1BV55_TRISP|nr:hypothetical protein T01_14386 [Trichinella spiralis]